jgi:DNA-binding NarL/FixJ family response regulator
MPGMNGIDAARRIREVSPVTRILILTAQSSPAYLASAMHAGLHDYVVEESIGQELIAAVRTVVDGRRYLSESLRIGEDRLERDWSAEDRTAIATPPLGDALPNIDPCKWARAVKLCRCPSV